MAAGVGSGTPPQTPHILKSTGTRDDALSGPPPLGGSASLQNTSCQDRKRNSQLLHTRPPLGILEVWGGSRDSAFLKVPRYR